jgi:O-phospho-L-seryl-tRNASec:L-selenocysteinyl-tRNA synthase
MCKDKNIGHVINNAYGLQSSKFSHVISEACRQGRVDAFVQSTDKNFLVPVGGSVVASCDSKFIDEISKLYPGKKDINAIW